MGRTSRSQRLSYLRTLQGRNLLTSFRTDSRNAPFLAWIAGLPDEAAIDALLDRWRNADPTRTGACTQWLIRLAIAGRLPVEDLPKARETLEAFQTYKRRLPADARDLGRYDTLGAVWTTVEPFVRENAPPSANAEERRERVVVRAETIFFLEEDGWTVVAPTTERASCWWGRGTRWCTAAKNDNMFDHYNAQGPLVIFVRPDGAKFQFHAPSEQFMNAADVDADIHDAVGDALPLLDRAAPGLAAALRTGSEPFLITDETALKDAIGIFGVPLAQVRHIQRTYDLCLLAVQMKPSALDDVPLQHRDHALCLDAVSRNGYALPYVPIEIIDRVMVMTAVASDPQVLSWVPPDLRDRGVCLAAVRGSGSALSEVPMHLRDQEMCDAAIEARSTDLHDIPKGILTVDMCRRAMEKGGSLSNVPEPFLTYEVCNTAAKQDPFALEVVPPGFQDQALCRVAIEHYPDALFWVPLDLRDREICLTAISRRGHTLAYVPRAMRDREMCRIAVENDGWSLQFVPKMLIDIDLCMTALRKVGQILEFGFVPDALIEAVRQRCAAEGIDTRIPQPGDPNWNSWDHGPGIDDAFPEDAVDHISAAPV